MAEYNCAARTWLGTLTLAPARHALVCEQVHLRLSQSGVNPADFERQEWFNELVTEIGAEITRYLKRVRKNSGAPIRYLLVSERHKSGLPHFHMLVHEPDATLPVTKRCLDDAWKWGFTRFTLVNGAGGAVYACKYLAKDASTRIRASFRYGAGAPMVGLDRNETW